MITPWGAPAPGTVLDRIVRGDVARWFDRYLRVLLDWHVALWLCGTGSRWSRTSRTGPNYLRPRSPR